ncbi:MAG: methyltransferase domain-containing protein [Rhizobiales bacterium]|nr:methyltransferase domain-containing protein [Hyphomicrobiales bacterium]
MQTAYDRVHYPTAPQGFAYPARFGALAQLCGAPAPRVQGYRALEIGCGDGVHTMAMALEAPESAFFGFDLAQTAIADATRLAREAGLANVAFAQRDILDHGLAPRSFDYVVAHGVYAWTPPQVAEGVLALIGEVLTDDGVAVVSYNVMPGCALRLRLREAMAPAAARESEPRRRIESARAVLARIATEKHDTALAGEAETLLAKDPAILFHDDLGDIFAPVTVGAFSAAAAAHGLDHLCDCDPATLAAALSSDGPRTQSEWLAQEAARDMREGTRFRRSVLVRAGGARDRRLVPTRLTALYACATLTRESARAWRTEAGGRIATDDALVASFLDALAARGEQGLSLDTLEGRFDDRADTLLRLVIAGVATLRARPAPIGSDAATRPLASPLARAQARQGRRALASLRGGEIEMGEPQMREFLRLLDGERDRAALARAMAARAKAAPQALAAAVDAALRDVARLGLLYAVS